MTITVELPRIDLAAIPRYVPHCAWCITEAQAHGVTLEAVDSHGICVRHRDEQYSRLQERKRESKEKRQW